MGQIYQFHFCIGPPLLPHEGGPIHRRGLDQRLLLVGLAAQLYGAREAVWWTLYLARYLIVALKACAC